MAVFPQAFMQPFSAVSYRPVYPLTLPVPVFPQAFMQPFSATQAALAEASQTAAERAQMAMQTAYAQAFKAKLDVTMKVRCTGNGG